MGFSLIGRWQGKTGVTALLTAALALTMLLLLPGSALAEPVLQSSFGSFASPEALAVDQETGAVYVLNREAGTIDRFDEDGDPLPFTAAETYVTGNRLTGTSAGPFAFSGGISETEIAVAPPGSAGGTAGNIYVNNGTGSIAVFDSTGHYLGSITAPGGGSFSYVCGVAVDPVGSVYVADYSNGAIYKFIPTGNPPTNADFDSAITGLAQPCNIAAGPDRIYAATWSSGPVTAYPLSLFPGSGGSADASFSGIVVEDEGSPAISAAAYVDPVSGDLYIDEESRIAVFDAAGTLKEHFAEGGGLSGSRGVAVRNSSGTVYVSDTPAGAVRIYSPPVPGAPSISGTGSSGVTSTEATLEGRVNPNSLATTYHFEYVDEATFLATGFASAVSVPVPDAAVGDGFLKVRVERAISGLQPGTTYYFRLVASNALGTTTGPERTLRTYDLTAASSCPNGAFRVGLSAVLPNCRVYEQVSPASKDYGPGGLESGGQPPASIADVEGSTVVYNTTGPLPNATAGPFFSVNRAVRTEGGWTNQSISPPQAPTATLGGIYPSYYAFDDQLSEAVVGSANPPLTADALPLTPNLYVQTLQPASYELLTPAGIERVPEYVYGGASEDFRYQYYSATKPQTSDAPPEDVNQNPQVYGVVDGRIYLVGILPNGSVAPRAQLPRINSVTISEAHADHIVSDDGSRALFTTGGNLYLRINADRPQGPADPSGFCLGVTSACTVEVSATQKINGTGPGGADPLGAQPVQFQEANPDLSRVLFTSASELTNDANTGRNSSGEPTDAGSDLYLYDASTGTLSDLTVDDNPADQATGANVLGVVAASEDLSYVYFVATGNLGGSALSGEANLYLWHEGSVRFIATLDANLDSGNWTAAAESWSARTTPDGRFLAFTSIAGLTGFDNRDAATEQPDQEVFLYNGATGGLVCASCNPSRSAPQGDSRISGVTGRLGNGFHMPRNLTHDGQRLFFDSWDSLVPRDSNGTRDVYMFEAGRVSLISSGTGGGAMFQDASPSGDDAFFVTRERLAPSDQDGINDLYDARVGGGFALQEGASDCAGEACRPASPGTPDAINPGSAGFYGPATRRHRQQKRKHRCKRHKKRSAAGKSAASKKRCHRKKRGGVK